MKVIMSVDSMFTVELTEELEAEFSKPDFNINKLSPKLWVELGNLTGRMFVETFYDTGDIDYHFEEILKDN